MPISHGHRPYEYKDFIPEMDASNLIKAVTLKQNLYDQGTQAMQAKLDELSGMDILKDVDREYANQELSKIYKTVQENAHADFSNPNTIKSFLNVVRPLENDAIIKNATLSTSEFRRRQSNLDEIRKKNPALISPANVDDFMEDVQTWFNDPNQGAYLNRREYSPYIDNSKKYTTLVKALTPQIRQEIMSSGKWMDSVTIERLTSQRVSEAIKSQLSAAEMNQLYMDAKFNSKRLDPRQKYEFLRNAYYQSMNDSQADYTNKNLSIEERQQAYHRAKADSDILARINSGDADYINQRYLDSYINNTIEGIGRVYEYQNVKQEREANPYGIASYNSMLRRQEDRDKYANDVEKQRLGASYQGQVVLDENGQPLLNPDGTYVRDYTYIKSRYDRSKTNNTEGTRILKRPEKATKYQLGEIDRNDEALLDIPVGESEEKTIKELDDQFVDDARSAIKYLVGEDVYNSDYADTDFKLRFETFTDPDGTPRTKVTVVDKDPNIFGSKDNLSFELGEMFMYSDMWNQGSTSTPEELKNSQ